MHRPIHWFNTYCRATNISDAKLNAITGHKTARMQDHYTHFDLEYYSDIIEVQSKIIGKQALIEKIVQKIEVICSLALKTNFVINESFIEKCGNINKIQKSTKFRINQ